MKPELVAAVTEMSQAELRELIALAAGLHAWRDGDGGVEFAASLTRIADRLLGKPRVAA